MSLPTFSPGDELGRYRLSEKIGSGGQGEVWRARDERFDRDVAVKILPPNVLNDESARERFRREARAVGRLNHPNVATAHDFDDKPVDYLVTEYVAGTGLDQKLAGGALPEDTVITLGIQLASGLEAAHRQGIIHRDLKPGNLRINEEGNLKILDFGLAEIVDPSTDIASLETVTLNMTLTGTLPYMAPEQFGGVSDPRTDLWSTGAVLYEMATGRLAFQETQLQQLRDAIMNKEPTRPAEINPAISVGLETVILHCLQKDPNKRYQSATALREDLARVAQGRRVKTDDGLRGRSFATALLALVLAVSAFSTYQFWPQIHDKLWGTRESAARNFHVLAVLPVESGTDVAAENALVRGFAQDISAGIAQGTKSRFLQVIPPKELIDRGVSTAEGARREFGAERVLEVALQHSPEKMRATCSLIDTRTHQQLDARTITGDAKDPFTIADLTITAVVPMMPANAILEQQPPSEVQASSPPGYELYLKGQGYLLEYQKAENISAAIDAFRQALQANPKLAQAYAGLGEAYWRGYEANHGKPWLDQAMTSCEKALGADPRLAEGHTCLGNLYNDTGRYENAVDEFNSALAINNSIPQTFNGLGKAYTRLGKTSEAEETYRKAVGLWPRYWAAYNWLGQFYFQQARYADAVTMFRKVTELRPDNQNGYSNLGGTLLLEGRYDEAIESLNRSIQLLPTMHAYSNLGTAYFYQRRYSDAVTAYQQARSLDDKYFMNWGNLGDALYWSPNRRSEATAAYKQAIQLAQARVQINPREAATRAYLAQYSAMVGDKPTATAQLRRALNLTSTDPDVLFRAALVYNQFGDRQQTLNWLKKAVEANFSRKNIRDSPDFNQLKADPSFAALISGN